MDIYLTRLFADQLYLFQYPLRPGQIPYENTQTFVGARLKPKNKLVQLDYKLDVDSAFHCRDHEAKVAESWGSAEPSDSVVSVDHLTFSSTNATPADNYKRFAVGAITPNGIQLSPLNAVFQLRPNFDVTSTNLTKATPASDDEDETTNPSHPPMNKQTSSATDDSATEEENSFKLVTMRFWRPEGRLERERKLRSYNYVERARQEERWIDLAYYSPSDPESIELRQKWTLLDQIDINRLLVRWRKTISFRDYFQLLLCNERLCLPDKEAIPPLESNPSTEQKPVIPLPSKSKKNAKTKSDKATKKLSKKSTLSYSNACRHFDRCSLFRSKHNESSVDGFICRDRYWSKTSSNLGQHSPIICVCSSNHRQTRSWNNPEWVAVFHETSFQLSTLLQTEWNQ